MTRFFSAGLAAILALNGAAMLLASPWWYDAVPGVAATGPFNAHFVRDIGAVYLVVALGLGWFAAAPVLGWPALVCAAVFLDLHGAIHIADSLASPICGQLLARDFPGVFVPALIASGLALAGRPRSV